jgi:hypothetical protein
MRIVVAYCTFVQMNERHPGRTGSEFLDMQYNQSEGTKLEILNKYTYIILYNINELHKFGRKLRRQL